jgi:hypothetical protein
VSDEDDNVISVDFGDKKPKPSLEIVKRAGFCNHGSLLLHGNTRTVECKRCGAFIDPFDALMSEAHRHTNHWYHGERLEREVAARAEELEKVKRQLKNAKAALARAKRRLEHG